VQRKIFFLLGIILILFLFPGGRGDKRNPVLEIWGGDPPHLLRACTLDPGEPFYLEHVNSIYGARVREYFSYIPGNGLYLVNVESASPAVFEYYGLAGNRREGKRLLRPREAFTLRSMDYSRHQLTIRGKAIPLQGLVAPGEELHMKIREPGSRLQWGSRKP
jgi:hypothetical protein